MQPVTLIKDITDQTTVVNKEAVFECEIKINYPEITLSWYKGTQKLDSSDKNEITVVGDRHILKIKNCQTRDEGSYRIVCGPHISSSKLTVLGMYCISAVVISCRKVTIVERLAMQKCLYLELTRGIRSNFIQLLILLFKKKMNLMLMRMRFYCIILFCYRR